MKIAIGADHGGYKLKNKIIKFLQAKGFAVADLGTHSSKRCDYPPIGVKVASSVAQGIFSRAILICKTGIGFSIVANRLPGVRAALCQSKQQAILSRQHNNANVLVLAANYLSARKATAMVETWLQTGFSGGRHARRIRQITNIKKRILRSRSAPGLSGGC
jgi:ribose 5-phosphate isomerase B